MFLGTISGLFFALGMCLTMIPQWAAMKPGIVIGIIGLIGGIMTMMVRQKMEGKELLNMDRKMLFTIAYGFVSVFIFSMGLVMTLVWNMMITGIIVGMLGIVLSMGIIPLTKGIKD